MATRLNPYIGFAGNAREAMEFYKSIFGGNLTMNTFGEFGAPNEAGTDKIMHADLKTDHGLSLMGADAAGTPSGTGDNISVSLSGEDADELRGYWAKLSDGGTVSVPMEKQMWGDEFGMCTDRFGVAWLVNITAPQG